MNLQGERRALVLGSPSAQRPIFERRTWVQSSDAFRRPCRIKKSFTVHQGCLSTAVGGRERPCSLVISPGAWPNLSPTSLHRRFSHRRQRRHTDQKCLKIDELHTRSHPHQTRKFQPNPPEPHQARKPPFPNLYITPGIRA